MRDLDMIKQAKEMELLHAAKARFFSERVQNQSLRQLFEESYRLHEDHAGRLDALEHQLGSAVLNSPYQSVSDSIRFQPDQRH